MRKAAVMLGELALCSFLSVDSLGTHDLMVWPDAVRLRELDEDDST